MSARYAIYYCPSTDSPLWQLGSAWLGRDAATGKTMASPADTGLPQATIEAAIAEPSRYGFHATFFAPFELATDQTETTLQDALAAFCASQPPFTVKLAVMRLQRFIALMALKTEPDLHALAASCVKTFDHFRAPLTPHDQARRDTPNLTPRQREYLARWAYPYVFDDFRFHMSLTGALPVRDLDHARVALGTLFEPLLRQPIDISGLTLLKQANRAAPFNWVEQFRFTSLPARDDHAETD